MQFVVHGTVPKEVPAELAKRQHTIRVLSELAGPGEDPGAIEASGGDPALLLPLLERQQVHLFTADAGLVRELYERKIPFRGVIVLLLSDTGGSADAAEPVARLFERYKRLTPGRLYTVTPNRVKIRQLPGAHRA
jgi:hypothetical protein